MMSDFIPEGPDLWRALETVVMLVAAIFMRSVLTTTETRVRELQDELAKAGHRMTAVLVEATRAQAAYQEMRDRVRVVERASGVYPAQRGPSERNDSREKEFQESPTGYFVPMADRVTVDFRDGVGGSSKTKGDR